MKKFLMTSYWFVFYFYCMLLFNTVFLARDSLRSVSLTPFEMIQRDGLSLGVYGNILMFIPLGIYMAQWTRKFWKTTLNILVVSIAIELLQYIFKRGATDIDDVILNTFGGLLGIAIYAICKMLWPAADTLQKAISILSLIVGVPVFVLTVILFLAN